MNELTKPRVKICCINSMEEAQLAIQFGASALGLVGHMPSGPGVISDNLIFEITQSVPPPIATFLLTSETSADQIIQHHRKVLTNTIQIVDKLTNGSYSVIKKALPGIKLVQVIHVTDEESITKAKNVAQYVDALLLDSGNQKLKVKELGGTGRTHDWTISRKIRDTVSVPVYLAGGINAMNVLDAVKEVKPFGVDLCSGVRENGKLNEKLLGEFFSVFKMHNG